jgi:hypothetical protein
MNVSAVGNNPEGNRELATKYGTWTSSSSLVRRHRAPMASISQFSGLPVPKSTNARTVQSMLARSAAAIDDHKTLGGVAPSLLR